MPGILDTIFGGIFGGGAAAQPVALGQPADLAQVYITQQAQKEAEARAARQRAQADIAAGVSLPEYPQNSYELASWLFDRKSQNPTGAAMANQVNAYLNYGNNLDSLYNSAAGPWGQYQAAAAYTAPSRSQERIAAMEEATKREQNQTSRDVAMALADNLLGGFGMGGLNRQIGGINTDYGASVNLRPTRLSAYRPRRRIAFAPPTES